MQHHIDTTLNYASLEGKTLLEGLHMYGFIAQLRVQWHLVSALGWVPRVTVRRRAHRQHDGRDRQ